MQIDEPGGRRAAPVVTAAVQVTHGAHCREGGLVDHAGSEEFVLARAVGGGGLLLLRLVVQAEAQKVCVCGQSCVQVSRIQPGHAEPVARFVPERQQRYHAVQRGRTRVRLPTRGGREPARKWYRPGLRRAGHNPLDGESEGLPVAGVRVRARGLAPRRWGGAEKPRWAQERGVHHLRIQHDRELLQGGLEGGRCCCYWPAGEGIIRRKRPRKHPPNTRPQLARYPRAESRDLDRYRPARGGGPNLVNSSQMRR